MRDVDFSLPIFSQESMHIFSKIVIVGISDAEVAEDFFFLGLESNLSISEDKIVVVIWNNGQFWVTSDVIDLLASYTKQKALSWPHDTIRVHRVHWEATDDSAIR